MAANWKKKSGDSPRANLNGGDLDKENILKRLREPNPGPTSMVASWKGSRSSKGKG